MYVCACKGNLVVVTAFCYNTHVLSLSLAPRNHDLEAAGYCKAQHTLGTERGTEKMNEPNLCAIKNSKNICSSEARNSKSRRKGLVFLS